MSAKLTRVVRLELPGYDQLQHLIAGTAWDDSAVWTVPARETDRLVDGSDAFVVIDDNVLPRQGTSSFGLTRQLCGEPGKRADCQSLVSLILAQNEVPVPAGLQLFLPDE